MKRTNIGGGGGVILGLCLFYFFTPLFLLLLPEYLFPSIFLTSIKPRLIISGSIKPQGLGQKVTHINMNGGEEGCWWMGSTRTAID